jgi:wnt family
MRRGLSAATTISQFQNFLSPSNSGLLSFSPSALCSRIPGLSPKQKKLCVESPDAVVALGSGHALGSRECQYQFKGESRPLIALDASELMCLSPADA